MNIPDKAVEAAYAHRQEENGTPFLRFEEQQYILGVLKAAAPFIAAQALRDAVADLEPYNGRARVPGDEFRDGIDYAQEALTDRANELDPQ